MITKEELMSSIEYHPSTGELFRKTKISGLKKINTVEKGKKDARIKVGGKPYYINRLVWLYSYGEYPTFSIAFKDGDNTNYRLDNLLSLEARSKDDELTQDRVKLLFSYDKDTGILIRKFTSGGKSGEVTDINNTGYLRCMVDGNRYLAHRIIWLYMTGSFPVYQVDHEDHNRLNNSWNNLREVTPQDNARNRSNQVSSTGVTGVRLTKYGKYEVTILKKYCGTYDTLEEASDVANATYRENNFHDNHGSK